GSASVSVGGRVSGGEEVRAPAVVAAREARGVTATVPAGTPATPECATLTATIPAGQPPPVNLAAYGEAPLPERRPEATRVHWASLTTLGTPRVHYDTGQAEAYVAKGGGALALYRGTGGRRDPGFLLSRGTLALDR